ncbi:MAG TPA: DUF4911 domain-containing protein [Candidatus Binatia bacterium]
MSAPREPSVAGWTPLRDAELWARVLRVEREEVAYFKFLFESYEGVGIVRTVETQKDGTVVIALLAPRDFVEVAEAILEDVRERGARPFTYEELPAVCTEDWFLSTWVRDAGAD